MEANKSRKKQEIDTLSPILIAYEKSRNFAEKAESTKRDYSRQLRKIAAKFGDLPIVAFADRRLRADLFAWRDKLALESPRQADYAMDVFSVVCNWALDRGLIAENPLERRGRTYRGTRADAIWSEDDEAKFLKAASPELGLALVLAAETGQRQGDLLALEWSAYDGTAISLIQSKTKVHVVIPCTAKLKALLDAEKAKRKTDVPKILITSRGTAWTSSGFRASWNKVECDIGKLTFHDLRGTAVTRLAVAGCSVPEIATISGHSLAQVNAVIDRHYLNRTRALADSAILKLEKKRELDEAANQAANHESRL